MFQEEEEEEEIAYFLTKLWKAWKNCLWSPFYDTFIVLLHPFSFTKINHGFTTKKNNNKKKHPTILSHDTTKVTTNYSLTIVFV